jgi:hypothetical protein
MRRKGVRTGISKSIYFTVEVAVALEAQAAKVGAPIGKIVQELIVRAMEHTQVPELLAAATVYRDNEPENPRNLIL